MERTLVILKPDSLQRGLMGKIIGRIEERGLRIIAMKMMRISPMLAEQCYEAHKNKPFYKPTIQFITSAPSVAMVVEGLQAVRVMRTMIGTANPRSSAPGTIRGDLGLSPQRNLVHGSDDLESAEYEIALFFEPEEICHYDRDIERWIAPDTPEF